MAQSKVKLNQLIQDGATDGQVITWDNALTKWKPTTITSGGSSSGIAGAVQISNGSGGFNADATNFFFNDTSNQLQLNGGTTYQLSLTGSVTGGINNTPAAAVTGNYNFMLGSVAATGIASVLLTNSDTGTSAHTRLRMLATGGDPFIAWQTGEISYIAGLDNTDDKFKLGIGNDPSDMSVTNLTFSGSAMGVLNDTPTAKVHIAAGAAGANTAPIKLTSGTNMTTPEAGAIEWDGTNLFVTQTTGPTRKTIAYTSDISGAIVNGGNTLGGALTIGTNDNFAFNLETNGTNRVTISGDGLINIGQGIAQRVVLNSAASSASGAIELIANNGSSLSDNGVKITGGTYGQNFADNKVLYITSNHTQSTSSGQVSSIEVAPTVNITGSAAAINIGVLVNPTLTSLSPSSARFYGLYLGFDNAKAYGVYQNGPNTINALFGKTNFGADTVPTEQVTITGNMNCTGQYYSESHTITDGAGFTVDWNNGNVQRVTIAANRTPSFTNPKNGSRYLLTIVQGTGGSRTITWPTIKWRGGTAPTLSTAVGKEDIITLIYQNSTYYGDASLNY